MAQNLPKGTPGRVLVLLTLLTALVAVSAWRDALRRGKDAWVRHPTALGDTGFLLPDQLPARLETGDRTVYLTAGRPAFLRRDDRMFRVRTGTGMPPPFSMFSPDETFDPAEDPKLYARTAPHRYVRLRASLDPPKAPVPVESGTPPAASGTDPPKAIPLPLEDQDFSDIPQ